MQEYSQKTCIFRPLFDIYVRVNIKEVLNITAVVGIRTK